MAVCYVSTPPTSTAYLGDEKFRLYQEKGNLYVNVDMLVYNKVSGILPVKAHLVLMYLPRDCLLVV